MGHQQGLTITSPPASKGAGGATPATNKYWRLSKTVTACAVSGRILFLDVAHDRYLALPDFHTDCCLTWLSSPGDRPPQACRALLAELGIGASAAQSMPATCLVTPPSPFDTPVLPRQRVRFGELLSVGRAVISASAEVRSRPLGHVLAWRFPPERRNLTPAVDLQSRLAIFRSARPLVPVRRVCLHDCLALVDWLGPGAAGISLVMGVSAAPFAAHSWLQRGDLVVDDHPDSPSRYQPILHLP